MIIFEIDSPDYACHCWFVYHSMQLDEFYRLMYDLIFSLLKNNERTSSIKSSITVLMKLFFMVRLSMCTIDDIYIEWCISMSSIDWYIIYYHNEQNPIEKSPSMSVVRLIIHLFCMWLHLIDVPMIIWFYFDTSQLFLLIDFWFTLLKNTGQGIGSLKAIRSD